jgi:hypothetical protein
MLSNAGTRSRFFHPQPAYLGVRPGWRLDRAICIIPGVIAAHRGQRTSRAANSDGTSRPRGLGEEHGLTDSAAPGGRSNSGWSQQDADAFCLANEHLNVRQLLAFQFAKNGEALGPDPRNHRKFGSMRPLQIFDSEKARVRQSSGTGERQSSALPGLGCQPVLFKGRRFASNDVRQLCPQIADKSPFNSSACRSAPSASLSHSPKDCRFIGALYRKALVPLVTRSQDCHQPHLRCKFIALQLKAAGAFSSRGSQPLTPTGR